MKIENFNADVHRVSISHIFFWKVLNLKFTFQKDSVKYFYGERTFPMFLYEFKTNGNVIVKERGSTVTHATSFITPVQAMSYWLLHIIRNLNQVDKNLDSVVTVLKQKCNFELGSEMYYCMKFLINTRDREYDLNLGDFEDLGLYDKSAFTEYENKEIQTKPTKVKHNLKNAKTIRNPLKIKDTIESIPIIVDCAPTEYFVEISIGDEIIKTIDNCVSVDDARNKIKNSIKVTIKQKQ